MVSEGRRLFKKNIKTLLMIPPAISKKKCINTGILCQGGKKEFKGI